MVGSAGLSRRGWVWLAASSAAAALGMLAVAAFTLTAPGDHARSATSSPTPAAAHSDTAPKPTHPDVAPNPALPGANRGGESIVVTAPPRPLTSLQPGDCLQAYPSKSEAAYPVVDCADPHIAQLLSHGVLPGQAGAAYPGSSALNADIVDRCSQELNWGWVGVWGEDVQIDVRYPDTAAKWASGERAYYCFVYTYWRHVITGSARLAG